MSEEQNELKLYKVECVPIFSGTVFFPIQRAGYMTKCRTSSSSGGPTPSHGYYDDLSEYCPKLYSGSIATLYHSETKMDLIYIQEVDTKNGVPNVTYRHCQSSEHDLKVTQEWSKPFLLRHRIFYGCWLI